MNTLIEQLSEQIRVRFPEAELSLDKPKNPDASWWLDVSVADQELTIEWRPSLGFGISARPNAIFGELSDEVYETSDGTFDRVTQLILSGTKTTPVASMSLSELRRHKALSQEELAQRLAIKQATVSKMERRDDLLLGTLRTLVAALGGVLEIHARFSNEVVRIHFDRSDEDRREFRA